MEEKKTGINKMGIFIAVIAFIVCIFSITYALFSFNKSGTTDNTITTGTLVLTLDESATDGIFIQNAIPVTDTEGLSYIPYTFSVLNEGTYGVTYQLKLVDDEEAYIAEEATGKKLSHSKIKYSFTIDGGSATTGLLSSNGGLIDETVILPEETIDYTLKVWIDYSAGNEIMGQRFYGKLELRAIQQGHTNFDTGE